MQGHEVRIGFVSELSPTRREAWSGTIGYLFSALQQAGGNIQPIGPILERPTIALNMLSKASKRLIGYDPMLNRSPAVALLKAQCLQRATQSAHSDVIFAPVGSSLIAKMPKGIPVAYSSDATLRLMLEYYPAFSGLSVAARNRGIALEKQAMQRADLLIYPTQWAADSAINDYGINPDRIMVQPFGANLKEPPPPREEVLRHRPAAPLQLLFCGVDWARKGGEIALQTLKGLLAQGIKAELTILGCTPPAIADLPDVVRVIPFLNKNLPAEHAQFRNLFLQADILILPTSAECYGLVFCEAAAFGAISIATRTGGIPEVIRDGVTGFTIPLEQGAAAYIEVISDILAKPGRLAEMQAAARDDFDTRLNWEVWGKAVLPRIEALGR